MEPWIDVGLGDRLEPAEYPVVCALLRNCRDWSVSRVNLGVLREAGAVCVDVVLHATGLNTMSEAVTLVGAPYKALVLVLDDDADIRSLVERLLKRAGWRVRTFASPYQCIVAVVTEQPDCLVLDFKMPPLDSRNVQRGLIQRDQDVPIVFLLGHAGLTDALEALGDGAFDYLQKPIDQKLLVERVGAAIAQRAKLRERLSRVLGAQSRLGTLSSREMEVCSLMVRGKASKAIAAALGMSVRTVEHHRARILFKCGAENTADMVRLFSLASGDS